MTHLGRRYPTLSIVVLAGAIFGLFLGFVPISYVENDDSIMEALASGAYSGTPLSLLVFQNYYYGAFLAGLYGFAPNVPWYPLLLLIYLCLVMSVLCMAVLRYLGARAYIEGILAALIAAICLCAMLQIQFTVVAGILAGTGLWLVVSSEKRPLSFLGMGLFFVGCLLRFEAAGLVGLCLTPFLLKTLFHQRQYIPRLAVLLVVCLGLEVLSNRTNMAVAPEYIAFDAVRGGLNDNPHLQAVVESISDGTDTTLGKLTANDIIFFQHFFADKSLFDPATMEQLNTATQAKTAALTLTDILTGARQVLGNTLVLMVVVSFITMAGVTTSNRTLLLLSLGVYLGCLAYVEIFHTLKVRIILITTAGLLFAALLREPSQIKPSKPETGKSRAKGWMFAVLPLALTGLVLLSEARERRGGTVWLAQTYLAQLELVERAPGRVVLYGSNFKIQYRQLFGRNPAPSQGRIVAWGWMLGHPANAGFTTHADLLQKDVTLFFGPDSDVPSVSEAIVRSIARNHGIATTPQVIHQNAHGTIMAFRRATP